MHLKLVKILFLASILLVLPAAVLAQENESGQPADSEKIFEARVIKVLEERKVTRDNGSTAIQQDLLLRGLEGEYKDREITHEGISALDMVSVGVYQPGDRVIVQRSVGPEGEHTFFVIDYVRRGHLYFLGLIFALLIVVIGRMKGLKALVGLAISFVIIIKGILPGILAGWNPLVVSVSGSLLILAVIIYLTEGWRQKSHLAVVSVLFSLIVTMILSLFFTGLTRLTGFAQEEAVFLISLGEKVIDFKGLLLAGMLIGAVGVLDDIILGQIEAVRQIKEANPRLPAKKIFVMAYRVGNTHLGAIVNTLFLTYAGASLPLLLLFTVKQAPFLSFGQIINNEVIATEVVRTFVGSIGVALSMPISTYLGAYWLKDDKKNPAGR